MSAFIRVWMPLGLCPVTQKPSLWPGICVETPMHLNYSTPEPLAQNLLSKYFFLRDKGK